MTFKLEVNRDFQILTGFRSAHKERYKHVIITKYECCKTTEKSLIPRETYFQGLN